MHLHKYVTNNIGCRNNDAIGAAFDLCSCVIRLQKIINREIVNREKHTHAEDGHNQHQIVQRILGPSTGEKNQCQPTANDQRWYCIDFHDFPETKSQGLFHQIQKEVTFCGLPHGADA